MKDNKSTQTEDIKVPDLIQITPNLIHINDLLPFMCILQLHLYCILINKSNIDTKSLLQLEKKPDETERENIIYVLECKDGKYYVGKTGDLDRRLQSHTEGCGSFWTKRYPYQKLVEVVRNADKFDEDKYVLKYMDLYGIDNVRGGSYSQMILNPDLIASINRHLITANNLCYICGNGGHLTRECPLNKKSPLFLNNVENRKRILDASELVEDDEQIPPIKMQKINNDISFTKKSGTVYVKCDRCGRTGHLLEQCFSKKHFDGSDL
jgi:hypothetical protein